MYILGSLEIAALVKDFSSQIKTITNNNSRFVDKEHVKIYKRLLVLGQLKTASQFQSDIHQLLLDTDLEFSQIIKRLKDQKYFSEAIPNYLTAQTNAHEDILDNFPETDPVEYAFSLLKKHVIEQAVSNSFFNEDFDLMSTLSQIEITFRYEVKILFLQKIGKISWEEITQPVSIYALASALEIVDDIYRVENYFVRILQATKKILIDPLENNSEYDDFAHANAIRKLRELHTYLDDLFLLFPPADSNEILHVDYNQASRILPKVRDYLDFGEGAIDPKLGIDLSVDNPISPIELSTSQNGCRLGLLVRSVACIRELLKNQMFNPAFKVLKAAEAAIYGLTAETKDPENYVADFVRELELLAKSLLHPSLQQSLNAELASKNGDLPTIIKRMEPSERIKLKLNPKLQ